MWYFLGRNGLLSITLDTNAGFYHLALRGTVTTFPQFRLPDALGVPWARDAQIPPVSWASNLLICIFMSAASLELTCSALNTIQSDLCHSFIYSKSVP